MKNLFIALSLVLTSSAFAKNPVAILKTSEGEIQLELFKEKAPKTVANFVGLAKGTREWTDPRTGKKVKGQSLYKGTIFHRVIENFMIQGGDPLGQGTGGPGYTFEDEIKADDAFDKPGILAMANAGPGTNGSQFFITTVPTSWLKGRHTIFGKVISGYPVVEKISKLPRDARDRPNKEVKIIDVIIKE